MDNERRRNAFPSQQEINNSSYGQIDNSASQIHRNRPPISTAHSHELQDPTVHSMPSRPPSYGLQYTPGLISYDPHLYQRGMLPIPSYLTGLTSANSAFLLSSNDNNNCNRSRAASHSTVMEMQQHAPQSQQPYCPIPTYVPNPYYDPQKHPSSNLPPEILSPACRRNSTTAVFTNQSDPHLLPMYPINNIHPRYLSPYYPYRVQNTLPPHPSIYPYHGAVPHHSNPGVFRRDRFSIGGPLTTIETSSNIPRHNSIPTALGVQQVSDETSDDVSTSVDDDDDVFEDSPPMTALNSATDPVSYLEQLRESRKRALSSANSTSQSKHPCHGSDSTSPYARSRFNGRNVNIVDDLNVSDDQKRHHNIVTNAVSSGNILETPSTSVMTRIPQVEIVSSSDEGRETELVSQNADDNELPTSSSIQQSNHRSEVSSQMFEVTPNHVLRHISRAVAPRSLTPSPSILKKTKIRIVRNNMANGNSEESEVQSSQVQGSSQGVTERLKSLPLKKQVAWKDVPVSKQTPPNNDIIMKSMKYDLLSEQNLTKIKNNLTSFTTKDRIGPYLFGPQLGTTPVHSITQFLVRKENSFKYYMAKVLNMAGNSRDDKSGRMLLYSEHSLLTLLKHHPGVIRAHGFHKDIAFNPTTDEAQERLCLILDCLSAHEFDRDTEDYSNLQQHIIKVKKMTERETIRIFIAIVDVVHSLHELNVVHRDLKLGNMVLLRKSQKIILTNFGLGRHLMSDGELLKDRRGSPAYISPDVLSNNPYTGKPSDMWSLGVVLYTMLYRQFPFYDQEPAKLFQKIKKADFIIPSSFHASSQLNDIIRGLLTLDPARRLTASETLSALHQCAGSWNRIQYSQLEVQVVPDIDNDSSSSDEEDEKQDETDQKYLEERLTQEFRKKMMSDDENDDSADNRNKGFGRLNHQSTLPTIQHCAYDARPLTENEMVMHRQLLVNSTLGVRVQGPPT